MKKFYIMLVTLFVLTVAKAQWTWQNPLPQGNDLTSVYFTDASTGYAVGNCGTILKTINGGASWTALPSGTTYSRSSVFFTDANTGYAAGSCGYMQPGNILKTIDAGTTWTAVEPGIYNR